MYKVLQGLVLIAVAFVLVNYELTLARFLLLRVNEGLDTKSQLQVSDVQARFQYDDCWFCIELACNNHPRAVKNFFRECDKYADDNIYPTSKNLLSCGLTVCSMAAQKINESCGAGSRWCG